MTVYKKIEHLDLSLVKHKLTMTPEEGGYGWPEEGADAAIVSYRNFLKSLLDASASPNQHAITPEPLADIVWHVHILFTEKYHQDCLDIFGKYMHHRPKI